MTTPDGSLINILDIRREGTRALGPGLRYAVWVQGCPFACPGCVTPEGRDIDGGTIAETDSLVADIASRHDIDGITVSGGEPMLQSDALARLLEGVARLRPELTVVVFTGFRIEELTADPAACRVLEQIDLLVDGRYVESLNDGRGLRGSSNQRLHFLTPRLEAWRDELERGPRRVDVSISRSMADITGIPLKNLCTEKQS